MGWIREVSDVGRKKCLGEEVVMATGKEHLPGKVLEILRTCLEKGQ